MRLAGVLVHLLIGMLAILGIASLAAWLRPGDLPIVHFVAMIAVGALLAATALRAMRGRTAR